MPRVVDPAKISHAAELYASGKTFKECAAEVGMDPGSLRDVLKRRGIHGRPKQGRRSPRRIEPPDDRFVLDYSAGVPENELALRYDVSRTVMKRWLEDAGVERRGLAAAGLVHQATLTAEQRKAHTAAAHAAVRGSQRSEEAIEKTARGKERVQYGGRTSPSCDRLCKLLSDRQIGHVRELAVGRYNLDIALTAYPIAVEVLGGHWHGAKPIHAVRTPYILDQGWLLVFVWDLKACKIGPAAADYLVTLAEQARVDPTLPGQYRVIRGDGQLVASGSREDDEFPLVPPSVRGLRSRSRH